MPAVPAPAARPWGWIVFAFVFVGLLVLFPPIRVASKRAAEATSAANTAAAFTPADFVAKFWSGQLQPAASRAPDAGPLLVDLRRDPVAATQAHARRVGLGNAAYFFIRGSGRVIAVERNRILVEINGALVAVRTGPVFGNVIRDGCGLLEVNQVPGLAEFNAVSGEINRLVEERVQPALKSGIATGVRITFAGCAEAPETLPVDGPLLTFIPVQVEVTP